MLLFIITEKDTLQPSKKWDIKFREKKSKIPSKTCDELVNRKIYQRRRVGCQNQEEKVKKENHVCSTSAHKIPSVENIQDIYQTVTNLDIYSA